MFRKLLMLSGILGLATAAGAAGVSSSADYSFDYATIGSGGGDSTSNDYSVVSVVTTDGAVSTPSSSTDYSTTPVTGADVVTTPVTLSGWSIE